LVVRGHDLDRLAVRAERPREEPSRRPDVAPWGEVDVNDLPALVDRAVDGAPPAANLRMGLIDRPAITNCVSARLGRAANLGVKRCTHRNTVT
jgi:hypothetical protein